MKMNILPVPTFNRLRLNETEVDHTPGNIRQIKITSSARLDFTDDEDVRVLINVPKGKSITVIMNFKFSDTLSIETVIDAAYASSLTLIQADNAVRAGKLINRISADASEDANIHLIRMYPGCGDVYSDCLVNLNGKHSSLRADTAYICHKGQHIDINIVARHFGKKTESAINANGVLAANAEKSFKGTIDFKTGCAGSSGDEREKVLLIGDDMINRSIPLILCTEEDVQGAHGANIGSIDEEMLFYLESRGMSEDEAVRFMINGMFSSLLDMTKDEEITDMINTRLSSVI